MTYPCQRGVSKDKQSHQFDLNEEYASYAFIDYDGGGDAISTNLGVKQSS